MIVIKVELHSAITGEVTELTRAIVANDGTGTADHGNYDVYIGRKGQTGNVGILRKPLRRGRIMGHPRLAQSVWSLVGKAVRASGW